MAAPPQPTGRYSAARERPCIRTWTASSKSNRCAPSVVRTVSLNHGVVRQGWRRIAESDADKSRGSHPIDQRVVLAGNRDPQLVTGRQALMRWPQGNV